MGQYCWSYQREEWALPCNTPLQTTMRREKRNASRNRDKSHESGGHVTVLGGLAVEGLSSLLKALGSVPDLCYSNNSNAQVTERTSLACMETAETAKIILGFKVKILGAPEAAMTEGWPGSPGRVRLLF